MQGHAVRHAVPHGDMWLAACLDLPPLNEDMSDISMALYTVFPLPESRVDLSGLEESQHNWCGWKDSSQNGMEPEPLEWGLAEWPVTGR